jgi:hypothetical protein
MDEKRKYVVPGTGTGTVPGTRTSTVARSRLLQRTNARVERKKEWGSNRRRRSEPRTPYHHRTLRVGLEILVRIYVQ